MGSGICTRRQKGLLQTGFCLVALACLGSGAFLYSHLQEQVKTAELLTNKYKQQQEALSAQLQVVYEHRSRLERSLQKERGEHKKTKEDFLVYKLEAQEALNKEKQDSMNRYGALSSQHKILKNQHDEIKKQLIDLQLLHNGLKLEHRKVVEAHNQKYAHLQREKDSEIAGLQDTVYKLREESKLLRKAHQELHSQLVNAQVQIEEFRQLKETLQKMPSFKEVVASKGQPKPPAKDQPRGPGSVSFQAARPKVSNDAKVPLGPQEPVAAGARNSLPVKQQGEDNQAHHELLPNTLLGQLGPPEGAQLPPAAWPQVAQREGAVIRFTRTVNSLQKEEQDPKAVQTSQGGSEEKPPSEALGFELPLTSRGVQLSERRPTAGSKPGPPAQSWQDIVSRVNAQMGEEQAPMYLQNPLHGAKPVSVMVPRDPAPTRADHQQPAQWTDGRGAVDDEELQMDAGMIEREEDNSHTQKEAVIQQATMSDNVSDPAQDPNNQGEDELEEAELERPGFEAKVGQANDLDRTNGPAEDTAKEKDPKVAGEPKKRADYLTDDYQEDEEQDLEDHQGNPEDAEDTELVHGPRGHMSRDPKKVDYY